MGAVPRGARKMGAVPRGARKIGAAPRVARKIGAALFSVKERNTLCCKGLFSSFFSNITSYLMMKVRYTQV